MKVHVVFAPLGSPMIVFMADQTDGKIFSVKAESGKEPSQWKVVHFANVGAGEPFVEVFSGELPELVDASDIHGAEREAVKQAILTILMEGLVPAHRQLQTIRRSTTTVLLEIDRLQAYENFAQVLWRGYKDRFQTAARLLGFDIGFLFQTDQNFETGLAEFLRRSPSLLLIDIGEFLRRQRTNWQQSLGNFRNNFLEHQKHQATEFTEFYTPRAAEAIFSQAWQTMAELLPVFIEANFPSQRSIERIPEKERDPNRPRRWRYVQCVAVERIKRPIQAP